MGCRTCAALSNGDPIEQVAIFLYSATKAAEVGDMACALPIRAVPKSFTIMPTSGTLALPFALRVQVPAALLRKRQVKRPVGSHAPTGHFPLELFKSLGCRRVGHKLARRRANPLRERGTMPRGIFLGNRAAGTDLLVKA